MKELSKSDKLRAFITPKMTDVVIFFDNNGKYAVYTEGNIHVIYRYLEMIEDTTTLTTSGQSSHHFIPSYLINNDTSSIQKVIAYLCTKQKSICE